MYSSLPESESDEWSTVHSGDAVNCAACGGGCRLVSKRGRHLLNYPELEPDDVQQAFAFAAANLEDTARKTTAA